MLCVNSVKGCSLCTCLFRPESSLPTARLSACEARQSAPPQNRRGGGTGGRATGAGQDRLTRSVDRVARKRWRWQLLLPEAFDTMFSARERARSQPVDAARKTTRELFAGSVKELSYNRPVSERETILLRSHIAWPACFCGGCGQMKGMEAACVKSIRDYQSERGRGCAPVRRALYRL